MPGQTGLIKQTYSNQSNQKMGADTCFKFSLKHKTILDLALLSASSILQMFNNLIKRIDSNTLILQCSIILSIIFSPCSYYKEVAVRKQELKLAGVPI